MRTDVVYSLSGEVFTLADGEAAPAFKLKLPNADRAVVRVVVDASLSPEEDAEVIESFPGAIDLKSGRLSLATVYGPGSEDDDEDTDRVEVPVPKGPYRFTLHATAAGPTLDGKIDRERLDKYFKRTRPGTPLPTWIDRPEGCDDFWVGLLLHLVTSDQPVATPKKVPVARAGKQVRKPNVCPPGLLSDRPIGWEGFVQTDLIYIHKVPKLVEGLLPEPLDGGPVVLPIDDLVLPYWVAWVCGETHPWLKVTCPAAFAPEWPGVKKGIKGTRLDDGWRVDIEGNNARWSQFGHLRQVAALLEALPDGSRIELACASDDGTGKKGRQRYLGTVQGGQWRIDATYPAMNAAVLTEMLDLVRLAQTGLEVRARDEAEADRVVTAIRQKDFLLRQDPPQREGLVFRLPEANSHLMPFLIARVFAARFPKVLPMMDRDDDLEEWDETMDVIAQAGAQFATGEVIFEGRFAKFTRTNLSEVERANLAFAEARDAELRGLGFEFLGDLHSTQTFQATFRGYALPGTAIYAAIIDSAMGSAKHDFYTRFADGHSLTTSAAEGNRGHLERMKKEKAYHAEVLGGITDRLKAHQAKVEELAQKHGAPAPSGDLAAFAAELDDYFVRQYLVD